MMNLLMNHPTLAFGIPSGGDLIILAVLVLVLFGAKKLPVFARSLGRSMGEFRKAKEEFEQELHSAANDDTPPPPRPRIQDPAPVAPSSAPAATVTEAPKPVTQS